MDQEYKELLTRSIMAQETTAVAIDILKETSKAMNDNLVSHNKSITEICSLANAGNKMSEANNIILLKYLKWSVVALIILLGGSKIFAQVKEIIASYAI